MFYQPDILPTLAELTGAVAPDDIDGLSIAPTLLGKSQTFDRKLYWEYGRQIAARKNNWKAIRPKPDAPWELYDLSVDIAESHNLAVQHPEILSELQAFSSDSHEPVRAGTFSDRTRHERDRKAKWGFEKN